MKKQVITASFLALTGMASAQTWLGSTSSTGNAYRTGFVGIGTSSPANNLHIVNNNTSGSGGIVVEKAAGASGAAAIELTNNTSGGHNWGVYSLGALDVAGAGNFAIYDQNSSSNRFFISGSNGNIGIGNAAPTYKLEMTLGNTASTDGLKINSSSPYTAPALSLNNMGTGAKQFEIASELGGYFTIKNKTDGIDGIRIDASGSIGIGPLAPSAKVDISATNSTAGLKVANTSNNCFGMRSDALGTTSASGNVIGIRANASGGHGNYAGYFVGTGGTCANGVTSFGIYATVVNPCASDYAGYFDGNVYINGNCTRTGTDNFTSDRKLKKDIKPLTNSLSKLMQLKPSSYTFKTDEFKQMALPEGEQMGLIAQDLEEVFPALVTNIAAVTMTDEKGKTTISTPDYKAVRYMSLIPVLIAGIQEQQQTIIQQTQINADLQKQLDEQKAQITALTQKASGATGINSLGGVENGFQMAQNEPNPFTQETIVKYTLPQSVANAYMAVYDLSGKQITTFPIQEKGSSSLTITSEKLSAGIYIYSIVADGKVMDSKRMIVANK